MIKVMISLICFSAFGQTQSIKVNFDFHFQTSQETRDQVRRFVLKRILTLKNYHLYIGNNLDQGELTQLSLKEYSQANKKRLTLTIKKSQQTVFEMTRNIERGSGIIQMSSDIVGGAVRFLRKNKVK